MITLAVDAMGGDAGLDVTVPGAVAFLKQQSNAHLIMVGDGPALEAALAAAQAPMERITVHHSTQVVEMDEAPQLALKNKKDSSMRVAVNQVKEGLAQAAVSAGNTGALMATARFVLKTIPGIEQYEVVPFENDFFRFDPKKHIPRQTAYALPPDDDVVWRQTLPDGADRRKQHKQAE